MLKSISYIILVSTALIFISCGKRLIEIENKDDSGNIIEKYYLDKDSLKFGTYTSFDTDGNLFEESQYKKGDLHGLRTIYFSSGAIEVQENYTEGVYDGLYQSYYENGQVNLIANYVNGVMEGVVKRYYSSGELLEEVTFVGNEENGPFKEYYKNGQVKWEGNYKDGDNEEGIVSHYDESGVLIKKMKCGKYNGEHICQTSWTLEEGDQELTLEYDE